MTTTMSAALACALVVLGGCATSGGHPAAAPAPHPTPAVEATSTTVSAVGGALEVHGTQIQVPPVSRYQPDQVLEVGFEFRNTSAKTISAFQFVAVVSVTDPLGRSTATHIVDDCTDPLAPGQARTADLAHGDYATAGYQDCTAVELDTSPVPSHRATRPANHVMDPEAATVWKVLDDANSAVPMPWLVAGGPSDITAHATRVTFADGTSLGTAVEG